LLQEIVQLAPQFGVKPLCEALGVPRATFYRNQELIEVKPPRPKPKNALNQEEKKEILTVLHLPRFMNRSPAEVFATLLDEDKYLCSTRTMYRILTENNEVKERRNITRHPSYAAPELIAKAPNQVWSWDITKLKGPAPFEYYHLYVMLDIFSRYVVGWLLAPYESADLACHLIKTCYEKEQVKPGQVTVQCRTSPQRIKLFNASGGS
jgi:putative transposase